MLNDGTVGDVRTSGHIRKTAESVASVSPVDDQLSPVARKLGKVTCCEGCVGHCPLTSLVLRPTEELISGLYTGGSVNLPPLVAA